ncbi:TlpA family protein disulfide reductase [Oligoflexus tunisiensis]|uniref:TlpA family protein disulfide reductase n=1 Tax=Oligoflexus tunisiensis TaxID=708132 RepID=UPI00114CF4A0|nr:redoxin family protein [Oligoflexus tunisiensis]
MIARVFFIMTLLLPGVNVKAADAKDAAQSADSHDGKDSKNGAPTRGDRYVHKWVTFPSFTATSLDRRETITIAPSEGRVTVLVFLASWCVPCQQQIREFRRIEEKFHDRFTDFVYIFAHDTLNDARGFSNVYKLGRNAMLASASVLEAFHQPELPSIYVADRYRWMVLRSLNTQKQDLDDLEKFLNLHTAL